MTTISRGNHTVLVTLTCDPSDADELQRLAAASTGIFAKQAGFLGASLLRRADGAGLVQVLQWESKAASDACMMSPDWRAPEGEAFMAFVQAGRAQLSPMDYDLIAAY